MARTVNEQAYTARRNAILDAAQATIMAHGYDQMAISDVLSAVGISSGAFYHYFDSKLALLEAVVTRIVDQVEGLTSPILHDPHLNALEKFERYFSTLDTGKIQNRAFVLSYMRVLYAEENVIFRQKILAARLKRFTPWVESILQQGVAEGTMTTRYPDQAARIVMALLEDAGDALAELMLGNKREPDDVLRAERIMLASCDAIERVIGAPSGTLRRATREELAMWLSLPADVIGAVGAPPGARDHDGAS
jgi:AcrR family transcriptional regulator